MAQEEISMKIKKNVIIIISVIVLLIVAMVALTLFANKNEVPENASVQNEFTEDNLTQILNVQNPVKAFSVTDSSSSYNVVYEGGTWYSPENANVFFDQGYVENLFNTACTLSAVLIEENTTDLIKYGLDNPSSVFEFKDESGNTYSVKFGIQTPTKSGYYSALNDEKNVYVVSADNYNLLCGGINSLRNKNLISINPDDVYGVTIKKESGVITILPKTENNPNAHSSTVWEMTSPYKRDVNQYIFEENVIKALDFTVADYIDDNPSDYSIYGLDTPKCTVVVDTYKGSYKILFGNNKDGESLYMQVSGLPNVYTIKKDSVKYIDYTPIYLMDSLVFSRMINCVDSIDFNAGSSYTLKIDGTNFYMNGNSVDENLFREAYRALIASVISGEVVEKAGNELCRFTFNYNTNTPSETVVFYEYGQLYAAVKVNGSMEFYVKRSYVDDMINAVNKLTE